MSGSEVAVICVTHDSSTLLDDFALALRDGLEDCDHRTVIVDSGSTDDTLARAAALLPEADVLSLPQNLGFAAGINTGVAHVRHTGGVQAVVVVNPDIRLAAGCVRRLVDELQEGRTGIAAPRLVDEHGDLLPSLRRRPSLTASLVEAVLGGHVASSCHLPTEVVRDVAFYSRPQEAAWATGGLLAISEECSLRVGPWDEAYFLYEEEVDFCLRAQDAGYALRYVPSAGATRVIGEPRPTPWAHALMRVNRWHHLSKRADRRAGAIRWAMLVADGLRAMTGRAEARAGIWALWHCASPQQVVLRYRLHDRAQASAHLTSTPGSSSRP